MGMKKNNKFRNNGNSNAFSLNYKFDSISPAGKYTGTALELIKRYNELAKEAHGSGDYVAMEVYRQYAEHYRKIVTEINERKNTRSENNQTVSENAAPKAEENAETAPAEQASEAPAQVTKSFEVIEICSHEEGSVAEGGAEPVKKKVCRRRKAAPASENSAAAV